MISHDILNSILNEAIHFPRIPQYGRAYELHKRVHLIDLPINVKGYINGKRNRLTRGFYTCLINWITAGLNLLAKARDGMERRFFYSDYGVYNPGKIAVGSDTDEFLFADYVLVNPSYYDIALASYQELTDRIRVIAETTSGRSGKSVGLFLYLYYGTTDYDYVLIAGRLQTVSSGQVIDYYLDFQEPWLKNFALLWYAFLKELSPTLVDTAGSTFSVKVSGDTNRANANLVVGTSDKSFSFDDYYLTNEISLGGSRVGASTDAYAFVIYYGSYVPSTDVTIYEVGLRQRLQDTGGVNHNTLLCRIVLSTPITLYAGKNNLVMLRILGM